MGWRKRREEAEAVIAVCVAIFIILAVWTLYMVAGRESHENTAKSEVAMMREVAAMPGMWQAAHKRAVKEVGQ